MSTILRSAPALLLATACAHAPRVGVTRPADGGDCEAAAAALAIPPPGQAGDQVRRVVTAPVSWVVVGAAYVTDVSVTAVAGVTVGVVGCLPLLALQGALHLDDEDGPGTACVTGVTTAVWSSGFMRLGPGAAKATRRWRCLDPSGAARETLAVARCFSARRWPGDEDVARTILLRYRGDEGRYACTPRPLQRRLEAALAAVTPDGEREPTPHEAEPEQGPEDDAPAAAGAPP